MKMTYHLGSTVTVVMRHESCGAVTAACSGGKSESVNLDAVVIPVPVSCAKMDPKRPATFDLVVHDHIHRVAQELLAKSEMLKSVVAKNDLTIIEAY
jgi:carbonic anhydrase